jgi:sporulation protein YlmC with PRC-barrel domain
MTAGNSSMVSSSDVNGTEVYATDGAHLGHIDHLMIDKVSGKIAYAVMGFGGILGMGEDHYPIPWNALRYDTSRNGYVTDISRETLEGAPELRDDWHRNRTWEEETYRHYGVMPYWI